MANFISLITVIIAFGTDCSTTHTHKQMIGICIFLKKETVAVWILHKRLLFRLHIFMADFAWLFLITHAFLHIDLLVLV
jgi:hypothetical protein